MNINNFSLIIWFTAVLIISLDLVIIIGSKKLSSYIFAFLSFITAIWVASQGLLISSFSPEVALEQIRFQYFIGIVIAIGFYHFSNIYPNGLKLSKKLLISSLILISLFGYLFFFTELMISSVDFIGGIGRWKWNFGDINFIFNISFITLWIISLLKLRDTYKRAPPENYINLRNMFYALFLGIIPPTLCNIVFPAFGYYKFNWFGPISSTIWIFIIAYSIIKYRQMNVKTVVTEVLAICMTIVFFINIFAGLQFGIIGNISTFTTFMILSTFLIKSALKESEQREQLRVLNQTLEDKVAEQTQEIRNAYEIEKKARHDLEKLNESKDQFIMITQHHLRTPVTTIIWQLESIITGAYGKISDELMTAIVSTKESSGRLIHIIDDFLNITALKAGTNILNFSNCSLRPMLEDIIDELKNEIARMNITVTIEQDEKFWPTLKIDCQKVKEILIIIVENAIRYNIKGGTIKIIPNIKDGCFYIRVENTGIGINDEEKNKIGSALFYRGTYAKSAYPTGMGIGLSVAKAIIKAHGGTFTIDSKGKDKGAWASITLPIMNDR